MVSVKSKPCLVCVFLNDVFCPYRKSHGFYIMDRCARCSHYGRFMREMEEEEDKFWEEVERLEREGRG